MGQQNSKQKLFIKIIQGQTQSHELFDFQNGGLQQQQKIIQSPSFLVNKGETVQYIPDIQQDSQFIQLAQSTKQNILYQLTQNKNKQIIIKDMGTSKILWRVIKPTQSFPLKNGDLIKIGKIKIQLKRIVDKKEDQNLDQITVKDQGQINNQNDQLESLRSGLSNCDRCRICFGSNNAKNDPLLCLCNCSGSIKFVHYICLKDWISNSIAKRQDQHYKFYSYNQTFCQLCKCPLKNTFTHQGRQYSLFDFSTFQPPYAQFQYSQIQNGKNKFYKYIINLSKDKEVVIGRNNSSQVVMKDISISRTHCSIEYKHDMLLLRDKNSKFGTLVKVDQDLEFNSQCGIQFQYQSKLIQLYQKNTFNNLCCNDIDNYRIIFQPSNLKTIQFRNDNENQLEFQNLNNQNEDQIHQNAGVGEIHLQGISEMQRQFQSEQSLSYNRNPTQSARRIFIRDTQIMDQIRY